jgi:hypothetical protein
MSVICIFPIRKLFFFLLLPEVALNAESLKCYYLSICLIKHFIICKGAMCNLLSTHILDIRWRKKKKKKKLKNLRAFALHLVFEKVKEKRSL